MRKEREMKHRSISVFPLFWESEEKPKNSEQNS
jgi:hypothetical protein